jgi:hypothetical protein
MSCARPSRPPTPMASERCCRPGAPVEAGRGSRRPSMKNAAPMRKNQRIKRRVHGDTDEAASLTTPGPAERPDARSSTCLKQRDYRSPFAFIRTLPTWG